MDTTPEYVEMCAKAWPDLKSHVPLFSRRRRMLYVVDGKRGRWDNIVNTSNSDRAFPLWEQDQLQGVLLLDKFKRVEGFHSGPCALWDHFSYWLDDALGNECWDYSGEALWLRFVMLEKYGKSWDAEKKEWAKA